MPTLDSSLRAAFDQLQGKEGSPEVAQNFLSELRTNWREAEKDLRRTIGTLLLAAAVLQLTLSSPDDPKAKLTLLGMEITDIRMVQLVLPVVVAYLFSNIAVLLSDIHLFVATHGLVYKLTCSRFADNNIQSLLDPPNASFVSYSRRHNFVESSSLKFTYSMLFWLKLAVIVLGPILFEMYAYWKLFKLPDDTDFLVLVSCLVAGVMILGGLSLLIGIYRDLLQGRPKRVNSDGL
jgi:hypothetical protein